MTDPASAEPCEMLMDEQQDQEELLLRQIPDHLWDSQAGKPRTTAFGPSTADKQKASHSRGSIVSASESRKWHNQHARTESRGVWQYELSAVIGIKTEAGDRVQVVADHDCPVPDGEVRAPGHCYVDFRHLEKDMERWVRTQLFLLAQETESGGT